MYFYTFTYEQITADLSSKTVLTARRGGNSPIMMIPTKTSNIDRNLSDQNFRHNPWIQSQRYKRFANTVQYLVKACRPTRELTTEHELVRSVVPSTSVSWCVWHIDHSRHMAPYSRLTGCFPISHTTCTRHLHRLTLLPYAQNIYVQHTSSIIIQFWMDNIRMKRIL